MNATPPTSLSDRRSDRVRCLACQTLYALPRDRDERVHAAAGCPECGCVSWIAAAYVFPLRSPGYGEPRPRPV